MQYLVSVMICANDCSYCTNNYELIITIESSVY